MRARSPSARRWLAAALLLLALADLWQLSAKFVRLENTAPTPMWADAYALIGDTEERVLPWGLSIFEQNGAGQSGLRSVFGYNALEPAATVALTSSIPTRASTAYDLLGAGYVVAEQPQDGFTEGERPLTLLGQQGNAWVYRRGAGDAHRAAGLAGRGHSDGAAAIARLHEADFDRRRRPSSRLRLIVSRDRRRIGLGHARRPRGHALGDCHRERRAGPGGRGGSGLSGLARHSGRRADDAADGRHRAAGDSCGRHHTVIWSYEPRVFSRAGW